ncbi:MAG: DUF2892 domain-containing protein [Alphaproteobacteria bacterium]|nr:DUF2892 domain-containing protein [Alphaproteobacteria bacterium]
MKKNVGKTDAALRVVVGLVLLSLLFILDGSAKYLGLIGIVPIATALMGICPAYYLIGVNTSCNTGEKGKGGACCGGGCHKDEAPEEPAQDKAPE